MKPIRGTDPGVRLVRHSVLEEGDAPELATPVSGALRHLLNAMRELSTALPT